MRAGTLAELGAEPDMPSLPTLRRFIAAHADFPVLQRGRYGLPYILDLDAAVRFVRDHWRDGRRLSEVEQRELDAERTAQGILPGLDLIDACDVSAKRP